MVRKKSLLAFIFIIVTIVLSVLVFRESDKSRESLMDYFSGDTEFDLLWSDEFLTTTDRALLIRDRARRLIGRLNVDNLDFASDKNLLQSIKTKGKTASSSCGPMAFALEAFLSAHGIQSRLVSFYWLSNNGENLSGHTAVEFMDENGKWVLLDGHTGVVWQNKEGQLGSSTDVVCQFQCWGYNYELWNYYPSTHGRQNKASIALIENTMLYMDIHPKQNPAQISAVITARPTDDRNTFVSDQINLFCKEDDTVCAEMLAKLKEKGLQGKNTSIVYSRSEQCGCK